MRPRKSILYICPYDVRLSVRSFLLDNKGYRVVKCSRIEMAEDLLRMGTDLVLIELAYLSASNDLARILQRVNPEAPIALIGASGGVITKDFVAQYLPDDAPAAEVLALVKVLCTRKRGPKPRPRPAVEEVA